MLTTGRGTHYCQCCGFDMNARLVRLCVARDGDFCEAKRRAPKKAAKKRASDTKGVTR